MSSNEKYFATLSQSEGLLDELVNRINTYRDFTVSTGLASRWQLSLGSFYGTSPDGKASWRVTPGGEFGELVQQKVNDYASYVKHQKVLAVKDRPAGIAKAINSDPKTLRDSHIGSMLVEYYLSDPAHKFEGDYVKALELALLSAEAFVVQDWDTSTGEPIAVDPETGEEQLSGDLVQKVFPTWNAARDIGSPTADQPWYIFSERVNKYELAAKYPTHEDAIVTDSRTASLRPSLIAANIDNNSDYIEVHKLIHIPTKAIPQGRYTLFLPDTVLLDSPFPYPSKNFHRIADNELYETAFGHTSNYDLLGLEQVTDTLHSIALNNQATFGVATIVGPKGSGISQQDLAKGLRYLELDKPEALRALELTSTPVEIFNYLQMLGNKKGELSGINSILRGDPSGALKGSSGSALALLQSQALVYNSGVQNAFYQLLNACGTGIIEICRKFADEPRIGRIVGKSNSQAVREFKYDAETLDAVSTIVFEPVNPVLQTAGGKLSIADNLLQQGLISSPKRYLEVLTTGNLNVLIEDDVAMQEAIIEENEYLSEGKPVAAVIIENHQDHIKAHQSVISRPNAKTDPELVMRVQAHIQEHIDLWRQASDTNPALLAATGQQVLPPMPQPGLPPGMPPQGSPDGGPSAAMSPNKPAQPNLPQMPKNPATGDRVPAPAGAPVSR